MSRYYWSRGGGGGNGARRLMGAMGNGNNGNGGFGPGGGGNPNGNGDNNGGGINKVKAVRTRQVRRNRANRHRLRAEAAAALRFGEDGVKRMEREARKEEAKKKRDSGSGSASSSIAEGHQNSDPGDATPRYSLPLEPKVIAFIDDDLETVSSSELELSASASRPSSSTKDDEPMEVGDGVGDGDGVNDDDKNELLRMNFQEVTELHEILTQSIMKNAIEEENEDGEILSEEGADGSSDNKQEFPTGGNDHRPKSASSIGSVSDRLLIVETEPLPHSSTPSDKQEELDQHRCKSRSRNSRRSSESQNRGSGESRASSEEIRCRNVLLSKAVQKERHWKIQVDELKEELTAVRTQVKEKERTIAEMQHLGRVTEEKEKKIKVLRGRKAELEDEIDEVRKVMCKSERTITDLQKKIRSMEAELKSKQEELDRANSSHRLPIGTGGNVNESGIGPVTAVVIDGDKSPPEMQLVYAMAYQDRLYTEVERLKAAFEIELLKLQEHYEARVTMYRNQGLHPGPYIVQGGNFSKLAPMMGYSEQSGGPRHPNGSAPTATAALGADPRHQGQAHGQGSGSSSLTQQQQQQSQQSLHQHQQQQMFVQIGGSDAMVTLPTPLAARSRSIAFNPMMARRIQSAMDPQTPILANQLQTQQHQQMSSSASSVSGNLGVTLNLSNGTGHGQRQNGGGNANNGGAEGGRDRDGGLMYGVGVGNYSFTR